MIDWLWTYAIPAATSSLQGGTGHKMSNRRSHASSQAASSAKRETLGMNKHDQNELEAGHCLKRLDIRSLMPFSSSLTTLAPQNPRKGGHLQSGRSGGGGLLLRACQRP